MLWLFVCETYALDFAWNSLVPVFNVGNIYYDNNNNSNNYDNVYGAVIMT